MSLYWISRVLAADCVMAIDLAAESGLAPTGPINHKSGYRVKVGCLGWHVLTPDMASCSVCGGKAPLRLAQHPVRGTSQHLQRVTARLLRARRRTANRELHDPALLAAAAHCLFDWMIDTGWLDWMINWMIGSLIVVEWFNNWLADLVGKLIAWNLVCPMNELSKLWILIWLFQQSITDWMASSLISSICYWLMDWVEWLTNTYSVTSERQSNRAVQCPAPK